MPSLTWGFFDLSEVRTSSAMSCKVVYNSVIEPPSNFSHIR